MCVISFYSVSSHCSLVLANVVSLDARLSLIVQGRDEERGPDTHCLCMRVHVIFPNFGEFVRSTHVVVLREYQQGEENQQGYSGTGKGEETLVVLVLAYFKDGPGLVAWLHLTTLISVLFRILSYPGTPPLLLVILLIFLMTHNFMGRLCSCVRNV